MYNSSEIKLAYYWFRTIIYGHCCWKKWTTVSDQIMSTTLNYCWQSLRHIVEKSQLQYIIKSWVQPWTIVVLYDPVKIWNWKFKNKNCNIQEADCSCRPTDVDEAHLRKFVKEDQYSNIKKLAKELDVNYMSITRSMHPVNLMHKFRHNTFCIQKKQIFANMIHLYHLEFFTI